MSNVLTFTGTVGRDAEVRQTTGGHTVLNVAVANNVGYGDRQQTLWYSVSVWGKKAEGQLVDYLKKGQSVFVSGELSQREYDKDGQTKTVLELNASILDLIGKKSDGGGGQAQATQSPRPQPSVQQRPPVNKPAPSNYDANSTPYDDDIPF